MRKQKLDMLLRTIELCSATKLWKKMPLDRKMEIASSFTNDRNKIEAVVKSIELPLFETRFGKNWYGFIKTVVATRSEPIILTDVEVMDQHNARCGAQYTVSEREIRGRVIHNEKFLNVRHVSQGKIEV